MNTLAEIFEHTLEDVFYAENAITKALPKVAKAAKDAEQKKPLKIISKRPKVRSPLFEKYLSPSARRRKAKSAMRSRGCSKRRTA